MHFYTPVGEMFPQCKKFSNKLNQVVKEKKINTHFMKLLTKVDKNNRVATFKDVNTGETEETNYDFLHLVPP